MMTKRGMLRAGLWVLALVVLLIGAGGGFALSLHHKFNPDPPRNDFPIPANALETQQQDIEQFSPAACHGSIIFAGGARRRPAPDRRAEG